MPLPRLRDRIYVARREAVRSRLRPEGWPQDRLHATLTAWEAWALDQGRDRYEASFWDGADMVVIDRLRGAWRVADLSLCSDDGPAPTWPR